MRDKRTPKDVCGEATLGPHDVSLLAWCLSYRESTKRSKERQGPHSVIFYNWGVGLGGNF